MPSAKRYASVTPGSRLQRAHVQERPGVRVGVVRCDQAPPRGSVRRRLFAGGGPTGGDVTPHDRRSSGPTESASSSMNLAVRRISTIPAKNKTPAYVRRPSLSEKPHLLTQEGYDSIVPGRGSGDRKPTFRQYRRPRILKTMTLDCRLTPSSGTTSRITCSTLCDLDTQQTVQVRPSYAELDPEVEPKSCRYRSVSPSQAHVRYIRQTPAPQPSHLLQLQHPTSELVDSSGDRHKSQQSCNGGWASKQDAVVKQQEVDTPNLLWLLDYRLDHLLEPAPLDVSISAANGMQDPPLSSSQYVARESTTAGGAACYSTSQQLHQHHHQPQLSDTGVYQQQTPHFWQQQHAGVQQQQQLPKQLSRQQQPRRQRQQACCDNTSCWLANQIDVAHEEEVSLQVPSVETGYYSRNSVKPPCTYTELIEQALMEEGELTVSGIYSWITSHFVYYKSCDDRWKNSVRHNLSMNPYFRKGSKAKNGTGHLWVLANVGGRKARRRSVAARMGRPFPQSICDDDDDDDDPMGGIDGRRQDIWLCSAADNKENLQASIVEDPIGSIGFTTMDGSEHINYAQAGGEMSVGSETIISSSPLEVHQQFSLEEAADRILTGSPAIGGQVEVQFLIPQRQEHVVTDLHSGDQFMEEFNLNSVIQT